jgi:hypothetical protein
MDINNLKCSRKLPKNIQKHIHAKLLKIVFQRSNDEKYTREVLNANYHYSKRYKTTTMMIFGKKTNVLTDYSAF